MTIVKLKTQRYEIDWTYEYEIDRYCVYDNGIDEALKEFLGE